MNTTLTGSARLLKTSSYYGVAGVAVVAVLVLIGWTFDLEVLKRVIPGVVAMNPLTATLFLFCALSWSLDNVFWKKSRLPSQLFAVAVVVIALLRLIDYTLKMEYGIDTVLFAEKLTEDRDLGISNRMAVNTAFCFLLSGTALFFYTSVHRWRFHVAEGAALLTLFTALLALIGYVYVVDIFFDLLVNLPMALHTAFSFILLSLSILFTHPTRGMVAEITSPWAGGIVARKLIPVVVLVPVFLGGTLLLGQWQNAYGSDFGIAVYTLCVIVLLVIVSLGIIRSLNKSDEGRVVAEMSLMHANTALRQRTGDLERTNRELEAFTYSVSHDLRTPLRAINGYVKLLREDHAQELGSEGGDLLGIIQRNSDKMNALIDDLLWYARVGRSEMKVTRVDLNELIDTVLKDLSAAQPHQAKVQVEAVPAVKGDPILLSFLWQNLLSNALKYSSKKPQPEVHVGHRVQDKQVVYFVRDNGAGFDMRHYNELFGVFHRLHSDKEFKGTGVGLAIAQKIVEKHHGKIWAEGKVGEGATFYVTLGAAEA
ncbi:His Kinase A (phospho-acceptor) domain-containing protein [Catalinimonas alkaloidigena]|uniref:histidine kinase n=1 Tax=Catalinimonas alkaloidigena TaxID=1075417 RepID=A0A1G9RKI1_9BACT|nr:ATP-binding protein [Catalinimonas alkaloidigena]SDM23792.1 His Kinase A (phospho-acceptor) domain-containing protein [Catalinimonas alkaloidigena]